jgi:alpha-beta hydrolase superfamily lysophospholipase
VLRAAALTLLGVVATAAGAGLGVRHWQKTGLSLGTVGGLALLGLGLVLLVLGSRGLWRRTRRWHRLWFVPAALVLLPLGWSVAFAVTATVVPPTRDLPADPADHGLAAREVEFPAGDGVRLSAWWVPGSNGAAVVLLHGAGENRTATLPQAEVLNSRGFGVLLVDARGHGSSEGRGMELGWYGDSDVRGAVDFALAQDGVERVGLVGLSMGAEQAIGAAAADDRVGAVVAEGATGRTAADKADWLPGGVPGAVQRGWDGVTYGLVDLLTPVGPPTPLRAAVGAAEATPFLLITAGSVPDEARAAEAFRAAAPGRVAVWTVPGARHTHGLQAEPAAWEERVVTFLDDALADPG